MKATRALDVLQQLSADLAEPFQAADLCQGVVDLLESEMGFELSALLVTNPHTNLLEPMGLSRRGGDDEFLERDREYVRRRAPPVGHGITGWVAEAGDSLRLGDVREDSRYSPMREGIRSELCVPLKAGGRVFGVLNTETTRRAAYTAKDQRFLESAATLVGLGLDNGTLRDRVAFFAGTGDGVLPLCSYCKKVRDDQDEWVDLDSYLAGRSMIRFSHGICAGCEPHALDDE